MNHILICMLIICGKSYVHDGSCRVLKVLEQSNENSSTRGSRKSQTNTNTNNIISIIIKIIIRYYIRYRNNSSIINNTSDDGVGSCYSYYVNTMECIEFHTRCKPRAKSEKRVNRASEYEVANISVCDRGKMDT